MENYIKFICNLLLPEDPQAVDRYLKDNYEEIKKFTKMMHEKHPVETKKLYRGILLDQENDTLEPDSTYTYLSFSEEIDVAKQFADTKSVLSKVVMKAFPNSKGYIVEHTPDKDEILFHHSWFEPLGLGMYLGDHVVESLKKQNEVVLEQNLKHFKLIPSEKV